MKFNFITTNFTKRAAAISQHTFRRFPSLYNQQCRAYTPSQSQPYHFLKKSETKSHLFSKFIISFRSYSNKSSNSNMGLLSWYLGLLESRPILTKSVSSAVIYGVADITSQMITMEANDTWDHIRTLRMVGFGLIILGPAQHMWFNFVGRSLPRRDVLTTLKKIAMGQLLFGPVINGTFFSFNASLQGENGNEIAGRLKRDLIPTLLNGLMYWPVCDFLTYKVIPVHLQPLVNSSFAYLWTIYLTYMASLKKVAPA